jgi:hypothetical protein
MKEFTRSVPYRRARRLQLFMLVSAPVSLVIGATAVHFLLASGRAMLVVLLLVAAQMVVFLIAEAWKTIVFGREVFRRGRLTREGHSAPNRSGEDD